MTIFGQKPFVRVAQLVERRTLDLMVQVTVDLSSARGQKFFSHFLLNYDIQCLLVAKICTIDTLLFICNQKYGQKSRFIDLLSLSIAEMGS